MKRLLSTFAILLILRTIAGENLCHNASIVHTQNVVSYGKGNPLQIVSNGTNGISQEEWIFEAGEKDFLTVQFTQFDLAGPDCSEDISTYSTVRIERWLDGVAYPHYLYCKGRRSPEKISSMGKLRVAYCKKHAAGKIQFQVTPSCNAMFLVQDKNTKLTVEKRKDVCLLHLKTLRNVGVRAELSSIAMKSTRKKCQRAFISVKDKLDKSLIPGEEDRMCGPSENEAPQSTFEVHTLLQDIHITYKNAAFTLNFREFFPQDPTVTTTIVEGTSTVGISTGNNGSRIANFGDNDEVEGSKVHIIAIGCGALLVLIAIIATLVFLKRRSTRSRTSTENSKKRRSTRESSAMIEDARIVRAPSVGSVENAMYGRVISGADTSSALMENDRRHRSRHERLAQLEEKYGPFPETSNSFQAPLLAPNVRSGRPAETHAAANHYHTSNTIPESEQKLFRKGTRPQLPIPPTATASTPANLYETIDDVHRTKGPSVDRRADRDSFFSFTSDECSDDELAASRNVSYDPVHQETNYATILDGPSVSYDPVTEDNTQIPFAEYTPTSLQSPIPEVQYQMKLQTTFQTTPRIDICPPATSTEISKSEPMLIDTDSHYQTPNRQTRGLNPNKIQARSHGALGARRKAKHNHLAPRPSLPEINRDVGQIGRNRSLEEDAENYLRPRPSCPEVITCAYSSSEDVSEIRRRLLAAAHPSLLDSQTMSSNDSSSNISQTSANYDSPRPLRGTNLKIRPEAQYASPRRREQANNAV